MCSFPVAAACEAIQTGTGSGIRIAVIDSGIEASHPALGGLALTDDVLLGEEDGRIVATEGHGEDTFGHGTAVAGIIRQIAPEASIGSFRVLGANNRSKSEIICEGVRLAIDKGYNILNCSFGSGAPEKVLLYKSWVDAAYLQGIHVVAACNNEDFRRPEWPGNFPSVVTVNMARNADPLAIYYKPGHLVEFATLGVNVDVAWKDGRTTQKTGSSFAAPRMTALLARMLSVMVDLKPLEAKVLLLRLATPWDKSIAGYNVVYTT